MRRSARDEDAIPRRRAGDLARDAHQLRDGARRLRRPDRAGRKTGIAIETAYTAAATAARLAIEAKAVAPDQAQRIAALDHQAYALVLQTRAAYDAGNADSYEAAADEALPIIRKLVATIKEE